MGRIVRLEVCDFKSYKGAQTIGPFRDFTAVIGPNGAGKSNLMDAISFVVGVQTRHLRGEQLRDLVYNADGRRDELRREALVSLVYEPAAGEVAGVGAGAELRFTRSISHSGTSKYRFGGKAVSRGAYDGHLRDIGVLVKARNFLVFQGDVESIASKTPAQLTRFFEEISSSGDLVEEYEALRSRKDEAETDTIFTYRQKKGISHERKQAREQKQEAERFNAKLAELDQLKTDFFLLQLWQVDQDIKQHAAAITKLETELAEAAHEENVLDERVELARRAEAAELAAAAKAEKQVRQARQQLERLEPKALKASEGALHLRNKVRLAEKAVEQASKEIAQQAKEKAGLHADVQQMADAERKLEDKLARVSAASRLTPAQQEELEAIQEQARADNLGVQAELESRQRRHDVSAERLETLRSSAAALARRKADLAEEQLELQARQAKMAAAISRLEAEAKTSGAELQAQRELLERLAAQRGELERRLREANDSLHAAKAYRAESAKERKMRDFMDNLKYHYGQVRGRLVDLCTPSSRRYDTAIGVALGRHMDAIVVDKEATGLECIKYMRDKRAGVATFLPLDTLEPRRTLERHRQLGDRYKLAVDVLEYDPALEKAVQYVLAGVVICDTLDDARDLCFRRRERVKAVTLDGHVISTNGDMTGGSSGGSGGRGQQYSRFEQKELDQARSRRDELRQQLEDLDDKLFELGGAAAAAAAAPGAGGGGRRRREPLAGGAGGTAAGGQLQELEMAVANAENRIKFARMDRQATEDKLKALATDLNRVEEELQRTEPEREQLAAQVASEAEELEAVQQRAREAVDARVQAFGQRIGVEDILAEAAAAAGEQQVVKDGLAKVREQKRKLESQLRYLESRQLEAARERAEGKLKATREALSSREVEAGKAAERLEQANAALDEAELAYKERRAEAEAKQLASRKVVEARDELLLEKATVAKKLATQENQVEKLRAKRHETLRKAELDQVTIPLKSAKRAAAARPQQEEEDEEGSAMDLDSDDERRGKSKASSKKKTAGKSSSSSSSSASVGGSEQLMSQDSSAPSSMAFARGDSRTVLRDESATARVDFSSLDLSDEEAAKDPAAVAELGKKVELLREELERMQPNMRAEERFQDVSERLKDTDAKLAKARQQSREVELSFEEVKRARYDKFMHMFEHVSNTIDRIYRELTKSARHPLGGNAYLSLDNTDEPYLGGIKYNAMPPTKRFRDMDQLSGGEKTVAALALLFAVHSYHPAPFFVMDEVDAALDNVNVFKVSNYIRRNAANFQCVVISLKDTFYDKADGLVGIYREQRDNCSRTLTLDLTGYPETVA